MYIWTYIYNPFAMGGDVNQPTRCEVDTMDRHDLGKGFYGYIIMTPGGKTLVVEERSGGIVGNSLERVRRDIDVGDREFMERQVQRAIHELGRSQLVSPEVLFGAIDRGAIG